MTTINNTTFRDSFSKGIDLKSADLPGALEGNGVGLDDLRRADVNRDGVISGRAELDLAFRVVDGVDRNGDATSFENEGASGTIFAALSTARRPSHYHGADIARAAAARAASEGANYADEKAPTSPLPGLSGNTHPGVTQPAWLKGKSKCNQFVGDSLTDAGVKAPTVKMVNGSVHYARAEKWPEREDLFDRITDTSKIKIGDVIVKDYPGTGAGTAHVEIVTSLKPFKSTGAHWNGASEKPNDMLASATYDAPSRSFATPGGDHVYILRPKKRIGE